jgi:hypothetical protein
LAKHQLEKEFPTFPVQDKGILYINLPKISIYFKKFHHSIFHEIAVAYQFLGEVYYFSQKVQLPE